MFKVAILQKRAINAQIDKNIQSIITAMKEASGNNADILKDGTIAQLHQLKGELSLFYQRHRCGRINSSLYRIFF